MQHPRFVFLTAPVPEEDGGRDGIEGILWILVSPNNRPLGRGARVLESYAACRTSVVELQREYPRVTTAEATTERTGQWAWRISLDSVVVGRSSRSYLRARECSYNLEKFLEAVPQALIVDGTRSARRGRRTSAEGEPPVRAIATAVSRARTGPLIARVSPDGRNR